MNGTQMWWRDEIQICTHYSLCWKKNINSLFSHGNHNNIPIFIQIFTPSVTKQAKICARVVIDCCRRRRCCLPPSLHASKILHFLCLNMDESSFHFGFFFRSKFSIAFISLHSVFRCDFSLLLFLCGLIWLFNSS